jgi:Acetyltransferase (GNAT) domain
MSLLETGVRHPTAPIGAPRASGSGHPDTGEYAIETMSAAACARLLPDWRGLADRALAPNPFMSPAFVLPAAMHLFGARDPVITAVWRRHARSRELVGLFVSAVSRTRGFGWRPAGRGGLWSHDMMPLGAPLLSADTEAAAAVLSAFVSAQRRMGDGGVAFPAIETAGALASLLTSVAEALNLTVTLSPDADHSRGLDINLTRDPETAHVVLAQDPASLRAMLEQALAMDAALPRAPGDTPAIIDDTGRLAFMRAVVRGFAQTGQITMARLNDGSRKAVAIALVGPDRAYLWRMLGPSAHDPLVEAALTCAIRASVAMPVAAATAYPVAGFCTVPLRTQSVVLS